MDIPFEETKGDLLHFISKSPFVFYVVVISKQPFSMQESSSRKSVKKIPGKLSGAENM